MHKLRLLPVFLQEMQGVHSGLFGASRSVHSHFPAAQIVDLLPGCVAGCGRHVHRAEIASAVDNSLRFVYRQTAELLAVVEVLRALRERRAR